MTMVHETAVIDRAAQIAEDVEIGPFTIIHANVEIHAGSRIGSHCEIGIETPLADKTPLVLKNGALIRSHSVFYESSSFGENLVTGHRVTVRENTKAGKNLQIGTLDDIHGDCNIGDYVRFHSNVFVGKMAQIGNFVWLFPHVVLTNDPHPPSDVLVGVTVDDFAAIAAMSVILPGVKVGSHSLIAAHSMLKQDAEPGMLYAGSPAAKIGPASRIKLRDGTGRPAYPWPTHFSRGYPAEATATWRVGGGEEH